MFKLNIEIGFFKKFFTNIWFLITFNLSKNMNNTDLAIAVYQRIVSNRDNFLTIIKYIIYFNSGSYCHLPKISEQTENDFILLETLLLINKSRESILQASHHFLVDLESGALDAYFFDLFINHMIAKPNVDKLYDRIRSHAFIAKYLPDLEHKFLTLMHPALRGEGGSVKRTYLTSDIEPEMRAMFHKFILSDTFRLAMQHEHMDDEKLLNIFLKFIDDCTSEFTITSLSVPLHESPAIKQIPSPQDYQNPPPAIEGRLDQSPTILTSPLLRRTRTLDVLPQADYHQSYCGEIDANDERNSHLRHRF